jgi:hypothetical protein
MRRTLIIAAVVGSIAVAALVVQRAASRKPAQTAITTPTAVQPLTAAARTEPADPRRAALDAIRRTGDITRAGFITRSDIIRTIATTAYGPTLASLTASQLTEMNAALGEAKVDASQLVWTEVPLTARTVAKTDERATVETWTVLIVGTPTSTTTRQAWRTVRVELRWERDAWRVDGWEATAGPTPGLAPSSAIASLAQVREVTSWPMASA